MNNSHSYLALVLFLILCLGAGILGSIATRPAIPTWYAQLIKPDWTPPSWVFGPVWTTLYILMALAAGLVWHRVGWSGATGLFLIQLAVNASWSWLFFGMRRPDLGLAGILVLIVLVILTTISFWRVSAVAGWLLIPYLLWSSFAAVLNFEIWRLNR
jgi:benzodiazapine receptor